MLASAGHEKPARTAIVGAMKIATASYGALVDYPITIGPGPRQALPMRNEGADEPGHKALRRFRFSITGQVYLVTTVTHARVRLFSDWDNGCHAARKISDPALWRDSQLLCWVLMPDHLHAMVELGTSESLSKLMKRVKSVVASTVRSRGELDARIWAPAFHDHAVRHEDRLEDVARYVVLNPVRAGLVSRVWDYAFWDAIWVRSLGDR